MGIPRESSTNIAAWEILLEGCLCACFAQKIPTEYKIQTAYRAIDYALPKLILTVFREGEHATTILNAMQSIPGDYQYHAIHNGRPSQRFWHSAKIRLIERLVVAGTNATVLDAGCGSGVVSDYLAKHCQYVVGIDTSDDAVNFARQQFERENLHFQVCSLTHASTIGCFDLIVCFEVLEHLVRDDVKVVLKEFHHATTAGGKLCITVPNSRSLWPLIEWVLDTLRLVPKLKGEQHLSSFSKKTLSSLLEESGWAVTQLGTFNGLAPFLSRISQGLALFVERREFNIGKYAPLNLIYCVSERIEKN